jgi:hypothetical protein
MKDYRRRHPTFALCGLNCGLCPRYHTDGPSRCPGCGGPNFHLKRPSCSVITCSRKHGDVEFCFQCSAFPCPRYRAPSKQDSFVTYRNVLSDMDRAKKRGVDSYMKELDRKVEIVETLIARYNDGKRKGFYCLAVNLLDLPELEKIMRRLTEDADAQGLDIKEKAGAAVELLEAAARKKGVELKLRTK